MVFFVVRMFLRKEEKVVIGLLVIKFYCLSVLFVVLCFYEFI